MTHETLDSLSHYQRYTLPAASMTFKKMRQGHPGLQGLNASTVGTTQLAMTIVKLPPGESGHAHVHPHETVICILRGWAITFMGDAEETYQRAGDLLFIPRNVPHVPANLSRTDDFVALTCRADPDPAEQITMRSDLDRIVSERITGLRDRFAAGTLPIAWPRAYSGGAPFHP